MATLASQNPLTPPDIEGHELQDGFHQLLQHNARTPHQSNKYALDQGSYLPSSNPSYTTPETDFGGQWYMDQYGNQSFMYPDQVSRGGDIQYYTVAPERAYTKGILSHSNISIQYHASSHFGPKHATKTNNKAKGVKDTEAWVNRSTEIRRQEAKKDNFVKRPSNSFILYRSAYAERARNFQKSANHQIVSSIAGESWAMEPKEIREQYDAWAKLERENHAKAFPDYKFQPQTNKAASRKRKGRDEDSEEESDLSDYEYGFKGTGRSIRSKKSRSTYRDSSNTPSTLDDYDPYAQELNMYHPSSYQTSNPGKPMPAALNQLGGAQYYQTTSHPNQSLAQHGYIEDVFVRATEAPVSYHHNEAPPVIGFPGAYHHELQSGDDGQSSLSHLDPMLASYDQTNPSLTLNTGHVSQQDDTKPQSGSYPDGFQSPLLNDFESEDGDEPPMGSEAWWAKHAD
ncbi:hypothetical protein P7C71_g4623, partial [Lecanoromycetidae sp. Uapishka_2]